MRTKGKNWGDAAKFQRSRQSCRLKLQLLIQEVEDDKLSQRVEDSYLSIKSLPS